MITVHPNLSTLQQLITNRQPLLNEEVAPILQAYEALVLRAQNLEDLLSESDRGNKALLDEMVNHAQLISTMRKEYLEMEKKFSGIIAKATVACELLHQSLSPALRDKSTAANAYNEFRNALKGE